MSNFLESARIEIDHTATGPLIWLSVRESSYTPGQLLALAHQLQVTAQAAVRAEPEVLP